jgi:hypothetical protein
MMEDFFLSKVVFFLFSFSQPEFLPHSTASRLSFILLCEQSKQEQEKSFVALLPTHKHSPSAPAPAQHTQNIYKKSTREVMHCNMRSQTIRVPFRVTKQ